MNNDQLYYFLVDKNTRNVMQIEYPSDLDEFNKILGTSEGKGNLLKDLGIVLDNSKTIHKAPVIQKKEVKQEIVKPAVKAKKAEEPKQTVKEEKKDTKKPIKKTKAETKPELVSLFGEF